MSAKTTGAALSRSRTDVVFGSLLLYNSEHRFAVLGCVYGIASLCYATDAGWTFRRRRLSARGNMVEHSFDWLTFQTLAFKVPTRAP